MVPGPRHHAGAGAGEDGQWARRRVRQAGRRHPVREGEEPGVQRTSPSRSASPGPVGIEGTLSRAINAYTWLGASTARFHGTLRPDSLRRGWAVHLPRGGPGGADVERGRVPHRPAAPGARRPAAGHPSERFTRSRPWSTCGSRRRWRRWSPHHQSKTWILHRQRSPRHSRRLRHCRRPGLVGGPVEFDQAVPPSGNMQVAGRQYWLRPARAGQVVRFWAGTDVIHLSIAALSAHEWPYGGA